MLCKLFVHVSDQHESLQLYVTLVTEHILFWLLLLYTFLFLINVISVNTVKVIIFVNCTKQ